MTTFDATFRSTDGGEVTLNRTYFSADEGGKPTHIGALGDNDVVDVRKCDGVTIPTPAAGPCSSTPLQHRIVERCNTTLVAENHDTSV